MPSTLMLEQVACAHALYGVAGTSTSTLVANIMLVQGTYRVVALDDEVDLAPPAPGGPWPKQPPWTRRRDPKS
jgi:hypothetical protein